MNQLGYQEVKLIIDERLREAERRYLATKDRIPAQPKRIGGLFGLRRGPVLQGA
jgi:hypothetical protein